MWSIEEVISHKILLQVLHFFYLQKTRNKGNKNSRSRMAHTSTQKVQFRNQQHE